MKVYMAHHLLIVNVKLKHQKHLNFWLSKLSFLAKYKMIGPFFTMSFKRFYRNTIPLSRKMSKSANDPSDSIFWKFLKHDGFKWTVMLVCALNIPIFIQDHRDFFRNPLQIFCKSNPREGVGHSVEEAAGMYK